MTVPYPITTYDGLELLRAGDRFNDDSANDIAMQGKPRGFPVGGLREDHNIRIALEELTAVAAA